MSIRCFAYAIAFCLALITASRAQPVPGPQLLRWTYPNIDHDFGRIMLPLDVTGRGKKPDIINVNGRPYVNRQPISSKLTAATTGLLGGIRASRSTKGTPLPGDTSGASAPHLGWMTMPHRSLTSPWPNVSTRQPMEERAEKYTYVTNFSGVDPTGLSDSTTGLQNAINAASISSITNAVHFPCGSYQYSSLTVSTSGVSLIGTPGCTYLLQNSTTAHGLTIGDGRNIIDNVIVRDLVFALVPGLGSKIRGATILGYYLRNTKFINLDIGNYKLSTQYPSTRQSYNSLVVAGFSRVEVRGMTIVNAANDCVTVYALPNTPQGAPTVDFGSEFRWTDNGQISSCGNNAIHIGGGAGGINLESGGEGLAAGYGIFVDRSLDPLHSSNPQIFIGPMFDVDSNTVGGIYLGDLSYQTFIFKGWCASNRGDAAGQGICIKNDATQDAHATILIDGATIYANHSHGVEIQGGKALITGSAITYNGRSGLTHGSGVVCRGDGVTSCIVDNSMITNNGSHTGDYGILDDTRGGVVKVGANLNLVSNYSGAVGSRNGLATEALYSPIGPNQSGMWLIDNSGVKVALTQGEAVMLPTGSGVVTFSLDETGETCQFIFGGGSVTLVASSFARPACATSISPNKVGITYTGSTYELFNEAGSPRTFVGVSGIRSRSTDK